MEAGPHQAALASGDTIVEHFRQAQPLPEVR